MRSEVPVGLDDQRRSNGMFTVVNDDSSEATDAAASRRASALAALAGVSSQTPPSFSPSASVDAEFPNPVGMDRGEGMVEERPLESTKKRLSAK